MYKICIICGRIFETDQGKQQICKQWETNYSRDACHIAYSRMYYHKNKVRRTKRIQGRKCYTNLPNSSDRFTMPSGCTIKPGNEERCAGWATCANRRSCLMALPDNWLGFTAENTCGYKEEIKSIDVLSQHAEYWGYQEAIYNV